MLINYNNSEFKWNWCNTCHCAFIRCPKCGNNSCNGGSGRMYKNGEVANREDYYTDKTIPCDVCDRAYEIQHEGWKNKTYPLKYKVMAFWWNRIYFPVKLKYSNFVYWLWNE